MLWFPLVDQYDEFVQTYLTLANAPTSTEDHSK